MTTQPIWPRQRCICSEWGWFLYWSRNLCRRVWQNPKVTRFCLHFLRKCHLPAAPQLITFFAPNFIQIVKKCKGRQNRQHCCRFLLQVEWVGLAHFGDYLLRFQSYARLKVLGQIVALYGELLTNSLHLFDNKPVGTQLSAECDD